ncbi:MAG: Gp49 family protein [Aeromonas veronii]
MIPLNLHPHVTPADLEASISHEYYFTGEQGVYGHDAFCNTLSRVHPALDALTICVLVLNNGVTLTGTWMPPAHASVSGAQSRLFARQNALGQLWQRLASPPVQMPNLSQHQWWQQTPPTIT